MTWKSRELQFHYKTELKYIHAFGLGSCGLLLRQKPHRTPYTCIDKSALEWNRIIATLGFAAHARIAPIALYFFVLI